MAIIRAEEKQARVEYLDKEDRRKNPAKYAVMKLAQRKGLITTELIDSARKSYIESGVVRAVGSLRFGESSDLVENQEAQRLIELWLSEADPTLRPTVTIGPDCSGNFNYAAEVVVEFTSNS